MPRLAVIKSCIAKKAFKNTETVPNSGVRVARVDRSTPMVAALVLVKDIDPRDRTRGDGVHRRWVGGGTSGSEILLTRQLLQSVTTAPLPIKPRLFLSLSLIGIRTRKVTPPSPGANENITRDKTNGATGSKTALSTTKPSRKVCHRWQKL